MTSKYFTPSELACKCGCGLTVTNERFLGKLDALREAVGEPLIINCGARCPAHNKAVGGSPLSAHVHGLAVDIACITSKLRRKIIKAALSDAIDFPRMEWSTKTWIHLDVLVDDRHPVGVFNP